MDAKTLENSANASQREGRMKSSSQSSSHRSTILVEVNTPLHLLSIGWACCSVHVLQQSQNLSFTFCPRCFGTMYIHEQPCIQTNCGLHRSLITFYCWYSIYFPQSCLFAFPTHSQHNHWSSSVALWSQHEVPSWTPAPLSWRRLNTLLNAIIWCICTVRVLFHAGLPVETIPNPVYMGRSQ